MALLCYFWGNYWCGVLVLGRWDSNRDGCTLVPSAGLSQTPCCPCGCRCPRFYRLSISHARTGWSLGPQPRRFPWQQLLLVHAVWTCTSDVSTLSMVDRSSLALSYCVVLKGHLSLTGWNDLLWLESQDCSWSNGCSYALQTNYPSLIKFTNCTSSAVLLCA